MSKLYVTDNSKQYFEKYSADCEIKRPLNVTTIEKGIILPVKEIKCENDVAYTGGVLNSDNSFVKESSTYRDKLPKSLLDGYQPERLPKYVDEIVIYGGILYEFYGHVLLETMSRLWYYYKSNPNKYRVVFNVVPRARGKFKEFFELLDIPYDNNTFITEPTQYKSVIVPEQASIYAKCWHKDYLIPYEYMKSKVKPAKDKKVYFTRTKMVKRNPVWGEKNIEKVFKKNGYRVYSPEKLPLRKQIAIMKGCEELATVSSSTYHNLLFAENNTKLICLNRAFQADDSQFIVDYVRNINATYIDVSFNPLPVSHICGPWIIGITPELKQFFIDNNFKFNKRKKYNTISYLQYYKFLRQWYGRNKNQNFTRDEVMFAMERIKIKPPFIYRLDKIFSSLINL